MPIEIKELHIKAVVREKGKERNSAAFSAHDVIKLKNEITQKAVQKVLQILKAKNER